MPVFYTAEEVAAYLKVSPQTVRGWIRTKRLAALKFGRSWRVTQAEMDRISTEGVPEDGEEDVVNV